MEQNKVSLNELRTDNKILNSKLYEKTNDFALNRWFCIRKKKRKRGKEREREKSSLNKSKYRSSIGC